MYSYRREDAAFFALKEFATLSGPPKMVTSDGRWERMAAPSAAGSAMDCKERVSNQHEPWTSRALQNVDDSRGDHARRTVDPSSSSTQEASILKDTTLPVACTPLSVRAALVQLIL